MARIAERFPFLFIGPPAVRDPARRAGPATETPAEVGERLLGFLSALALACFFHRVGHSEALRRTVRKALRSNAGESARRLLEAMFEQEREAVLDLFLTGAARAPDALPGVGEWLSLLR
ncbi:MAG: hypothetical protein HY509_03720, partial [Acidobacteria bacterium]|nr:hypothetical protein [Acidobacteriota bacterium]